MSQIPQEDIDRAIEWIDNHKLAMFRLVDRAVARSAKYMNAERHQSLRQRNIKSDNHITSELIRYWIIQEIENNANLDLAMEDKRAALRSPIKNSIRFSFDGFDVKINASPKYEPRNPTSGVVRFMTQSHYEGRDIQGLFFEEGETIIPPYNPNIAIRYQLDAAKKNLVALLFIVPDGWDKDGKLIKLHDKGMTVEEVISLEMYEATKPMKCVAENPSEKDLPLGESEQEVSVNEDDQR